MTKGILVNFWGTLLMTEELKEVAKYGCRYIGEDDWREENVVSCSLDNIL